MQHHRFITCLTGRKEAYLDAEHFKDVTGYTNPNESKHDMFIIGHTSTSISLALGLAEGRDLNKEHENIIAVIGDGSLSGGEALEALDYAGEYKNNFIIIINDNDQSIAENHGGMYKTLKELRETNGESKNNLFKAFGLDYKYLDDGHDLKKLVDLFESVENIDHPVVLHIHTVKGKGLKYAEENREAWHSGGPFNVKDGSPKYGANIKHNTTVFDSLKNLLDTNEKAIVLNAGTPMELGFVQGVRDEYVKRGQFIDVEIAEENMVAMSSGIAKNGGTVVFGTHAPFFQRTYDQISHDLCLNDSPATIFSNLVIITVLNQLLKNILQRSRPTEYRIIEETGYSFPSGHSMISMAFYGYLIYLIYKYVKNKYVKWTSIVLLSTLICSIGISRIYLGVHYTSDVLGGFLISISYLVIYISAVNKFLIEK